MGEMMVKGFLECYSMASGERPKHRERVWLYTRAGELLSGVWWDNIGAFLDPVEEYEIFNNNQILFWCRPTMGFINATYWGAPYDE